MRGFRKPGLFARDVRRAFLWLFALTACMVIPPASAQQAGEETAAGYITALQLPAGFEVDREHVLLARDTAIGLDRGKKAETNSPLIHELRIGAHVEVIGNLDYKTKNLIARTIFIRDDWNKKVDGFGVIFKVVEAGPYPVFRADGYDIRINADTATSFLGDLKSLSNITANCWLRFEGKRDDKGVLDASKATFAPAKPRNFKALQGIEVASVQVKPVDGNASGAASGATESFMPGEDGTALTEDKQVKIGPFSHWHTLPADQPLQQRVHDLGMKLIPAYQLQLPDDDPSRIHFRFYAADYSRTRTDICLLDGVIIVPMQVVERLQNDDQIAAVLADGIAFNLQRQAARNVVNMRKYLSVAAAEAAAGFFVPMPVVGIPGSNPYQAMEEERGRIALSLMVDAGYDPWQAPQAWRLLGPRRLPKDLGSLVYPDRSVYQLNILNLQYRKAESPATSSATH